MVILKMQFIIFILYFSLNLSFVNMSFCFWNSGCPYKCFSSKTPYNSIRGDIRDSIIKIKDCEPISLWALYRNGKTYPSKTSANNMENAIQIRNYITESYERGKCSLCGQDVDNLKNWRKDNRLFKGVQTLTDEGYQELFGIAKRLKIAYPNLLKSIKQDEYTFRIARGNTISESANAYVEAFGDKKIKIDQVNADDIVAPYASCRKYKNDVTMNPKTHEEAAKYQKSSEFLAMKDRIQRRAGLEQKLSDVNVTALYDLCRYSWSSIDGKPSPWCAIFTSEDLQILEYIEDLKQYYENGYGTPMNKLFGQIILADVLKSFRQAKSSGGKKITAYFSQSTAIDMTLSALGLFKDKEPLSGLRRSRDRKWKGCKQSSFSSNIMAVLNRCGKNGGDDYNVVFYLNEQPIKSICGKGICPWNEFEDKLKPFVDIDLGFCNLTNV